MAGASHGKMILLALVLGLFTAMVAMAAPDDEDRLVELSFSVPEGSAPVTGVSLEEGGITVRLPPGGGVPADIVASSAGLALSGKLHHEPDGSLRYEIRLGDSSLDQVLFLADHLVLKLKARPVSREGSGLARQYRLGADDKIQISVGGHPDLQTHVVVKSNGMITAPMVGEVQASGKTVQEIAKDVAGRLEVDFLVNPQVDVQVTGYNSQWVLVTGQVVAPQRVFLRGGTTLQEIIAEAGGLTGLAGSRIMVTESPESPAGTQTALVVDRHEFEAGTTHVVPRHGSIVNVEKIAYAYIQGEIQKSGTVLLEPGMTLLKAIAISGGLTEWADRKEIRILDSTGGGPARVFNLKRIQAQKEPDPPIEEGQMIIVSRRFL